MIIAKNPGVVEKVDATKIVVRKTKDNGRRRYPGPYRARYL